MRSRLAALILVAFPANGFSEGITLQSSPFRWCAALYFAAEVQFDFYRHEQKALHPDREDFADRRRFSLSLAARYEAPIDVVEGEDSRLAWVIRRSHSVYQPFLNAYDHACDDFCHPGYGPLAGEIAECNLLLANDGYQSK